MVAAVAAAHAAPDLAMVVAGGALRQQSLAKTPTPASQVVVCARTTRQQSRFWKRGPWLQYLLLLANPFTTISLPHALTITRALALCCARGNRLVTCIKGGEA